MTAESPNPPRFFCPKLPEPGVSDELCTLSSPESAHARKVLRLSAGDPVELFDGQGSLAQATLTRYDAGQAVCEVGSVSQHTPPCPSLTLACAIPKGAHADQMIGQLTQLGVDRLVPLRTKRSVVDPRPAKLDRFAKASIEAAKQCRRLTLMRIDPIQSPGDVWQDEAFGLKLIASPDAAAVPDLGTRLKQVSEVLVLVGPEGGFTPEELAGAKDAGCLAWNIGPNILRIETAAAASAAILRWLTHG
jgi:16S rRNA (uracil1498-N3)-methyltransferase